MDTEKAAQEDLSEINDNRRLVVLESPPYKNARHDAKDGDDGIDNWVFGGLVSLAHSRASGSIPRFHVDVR
jgi:hypothetical protein